jgi:DNA-binding CsgD family transcriptional regulator
VAALQRADVPSVTRHLRAWGDQLAASGLSGVETHARALLAESAAQIGDLGTAAEQSRQAQELAWATRQRAWRMRASVTEALVAALRGTPEAPQLVEAVHRTVLCEAGEARLPAELAHAVSLTAAEEWGDAFEILVSLTAQLSECPALLGFGLLGHLAMAGLHAHRETEARQVISQVAESSAECERGSGLVDLLYATALLAPAAESEACFQVLQSLSPADWPCVRARTDLARGVALRRGRRIVESRAHLLSAQRLFTAVESPVWERRAQNELRAAGLRDHRPDTARGTGDWTHLTPQEREIVRLAAEGFTNRQIGERLFLSPRTIGAHLYRTFPKLGIASRHQLARLDLSS